MAPLRHSLTWRAGGLLLGLLCGAGSLVADEIDQRENELQQIRQRIESLQGDLGSAEQRRQGLIDELRATERNIGDTSRRLRVLDGQLGRQQRRLEELQRQRRGQQVELDLQREALARQVRAAYAMGRQQRLKILLNQQDPATLSRMLVYYDYFNRARSTQIDRIGALLELLQRSGEEIVAEQQRLRQLQQRELAQQQQLQQGQVLRQQVVVALNASLQDKGAQLKGLQQDEQQLQALILQLQDELVTLPLDVAGKQPFASLKGKLRWPAKGRLSASFGSRKAGNLTWDGVIITAPEGREVTAVHRGRVAFADWLRGFGLLLIVDHGDGYMTLYGNNQSLFKETGEWVEPGEPVALVGSSGGRAKSGVYFGIRYNGKPVNPARWCQRPKGRRVGKLLNKGTEYWSNDGLTGYRVGWV